MIDPRDIKSIVFNPNAKMVEYIADNGYVLFRKPSTIQQATEIVRQWLEYRKKISDIEESKK